MISPGRVPGLRPDDPGGGAEEADVYQCDLTRRQIAWTSEKDLLTSLKAQSLDLAPVRCGGDDPIAERREQWTDGANAFALAPGIILLYDRNVRTAEELGRAGYRIVDEDGPASGPRGARPAQGQVRRAPGRPRAVPRPWRPALHGHAPREEEL